MPKKIKLNLEDLNVESFETSTNRRITGGTKIESVWKRCDVHDTDADCSDYYCRTDDPAFC